ncbi:MAG: hypothetical protein QOH63_1942 [Acidobacteriota bacterium]|jgi:hypothetical protein|nr:hypothetical protein [Acidobacteriota bacterium]
MRRVKHLVIALALALSVVSSVKAGEIEVGGFCDSPECAQANPAPQGYSWTFVDGLYWLMSIV